jgi:hypothetical protein
MPFYCYNPKYILIFTALFGYDIKEHPQIIWLKVINFRESVSGTRADIPMTGQCMSRAVLCFCHSLLQILAIQLCPILSPKIELYQ